MDIIKASRRLSDIELKITIENLQANILWFRAMTNNGQWSISRHMHSSYEFHFVSEGSCLVITDSNKFEASEGEFYLTAPGVYHEQRDIGQGKYTEYSLNCDFIKLNENWTEAQAILQILSSAECKPVKDSYGIIGYFSKVLEEAHDRRTGYFNNIKNLTSIIIVNTARALSDNNNLNKIESSLNYEIPMKIKKDEFRFVQISKFIEDNIGSPITTIDVANFMYLSDKQISRIIKERTGSSTKEFINTIRLQKAKELLKDTNLRIKEIAVTLGFTSEYYFNQFFKREEGFPPGVYRNNIQNV